MPSAPQRRTRHNRYLCCAITLLQSRRETASREVAVNWRHLQSVSVAQTCHANANGQLSSCRRVNSGRIAPLLSTTLKTVKPQLMHALPATVLIVHYCPEEVPAHYGESMSLKLTDSASDASQMSRAKTLKQWDCKTTVPKKQNDSHQPEDRKIIKRYASWTGHRP
jgi:hypothetical protein